MLLLVFRHGRIYFSGQFIVPKLLHVFFRWLAQRAVVVMVYGFHEIGQLREVRVFGRVLLLLFVEKASRIRPHGMISLEKVSHTSVPFKYPRFTNSPIVSKKSNKFISSGGSSTPASLFLA